MLNSKLHDRVKRESKKYRVKSVNTKKTAREESVKFDNVGSGLNNSMVKFAWIKKKGI